MKIMNIEALFKLTYGLYIVSSKDGEKMTGHVSNTVFQVTAEPPQMAICSHKDNLTTTYINKSGVFSISALSNDARLDFLGNWGFKSGSELEKFEDVNYKVGQTGTPILLDKTIAFFECKVNKQIDVGSHIIFIGDLIDAQLIDDSADPLTYKYYREVIKGLSPKNSPTYIGKDKIDSDSRKDTLKETDEIEKSVEKPSKYMCTVCGYTYDPEEGDPHSGIPPGTPFEDIPDDWSCPVCGVSKDSFKKLKE